MLDNIWAAPLLGAIVGLGIGVAVGTRGSSEDPWTISVERSRETFANTLALIFTALSIVLALASVASQGVASRFGSRALRIYARRSVDRWIISLFAMSAMFVFVMQFNMRRLDEGAPAPSVALVTAALLLVVTGSSVVWYVASLIRWFRVDRVAGRLGELVLSVAHELASQRHPQATAVEGLPERPDSAVDLLAPATGHIAEIDVDVILDRCREHDVSVVISLPIGYPVVEGQPIGWTELRDGASGDAPRRVVAGSVDVARRREVLLSIEYPLAALSDAAIIALSTGTNDPNSACEVIEEMIFLFHELAPVPLGPYVASLGDGGPSVTVAGRNFGELVELATMQICHYGNSDPYVTEWLRRLATSLQVLDLGPVDRRRVDAFAARIPDQTTAASGTTASGYLDDGGRAVTAKPAS